MSKPPISLHTVKRASAVAVLLIAVFLFLSCRILAIQVLDFERYQKKVLDQLTTESPVRAARGEILDAAGRVLATNRTVYRLSLFPSVAARTGVDGEKLAAELSALYPALSTEKILEHLSHKGELERTLIRSMEREDAEMLLAFIDEKDYYDILALEAVEERYYPYGSLAAHVIGFTGSDGQGLYGLELQYDSLLSGEAGAYITARDSTGNELPNRYEAYVEAVDGATLYTTIDVFVQASLEEQLEATYIESGAKNRVCGVILDVNTGAVRAMATYPAFDLNDPFTLNPYAMAELEALSLEESSEAYHTEKNRLLLEMWSNKAATEIYMPGSTFKALTCSMVLEEGAVVDLEERFYCSGVHCVADRMIHCHKNGGHGSLTFREGLQNSCNPVMMTIAARIGCDTFYEYFKKFGLLEKTGIDLPGEGGSIFHAPSNFKELDLATASFGQNFKISVLQLITAVSAVANGGELLTPFLVERAVAPNGDIVYEKEKTVRRRVISEKTASTVSEILAEGVAGDGGAKNAYVPGYRVAAKTGTSEKIGDDASARIGSCIGYAPADAPEVACLIVVDEPTDGSRYGSVVAAPYVANVLSAVLPYLGVEAVYTEEEAENAKLPVPNCIGWSVDEATQLLEEAGYSVRFEGEGASVAGQMPHAGELLVASGTCIVLQLGESEVKHMTVPDVVGMSAVEAARAIIDSGFNLRIVGARSLREAASTVIGQSVAAGSEAPCGSVITLYFPYEESSE